MSASTTLGLVVPTALRSAAAAIVATLAGRPGDARPEFYSIELERAPLGLRLEWGAIVTTDHAYADQVADLAPQIPGGLWVVLRDDRDLAAQAASRPTWLAWLASQGLAQVERDPFA